MTRLGACIYKCAYQGTSSCMAALSPEEAAESFCIRQLNSVCEDDVICIRVSKDEHDWDVDVNIIVDVAAGLAREVSK